MFIFTNNHNQKEHAL